MSTFVIEFRAKPFPVRQGVEATAPTRMAINWKKTLARTDCNMRAVNHDYFNSDLFPALLNRKYRAVIGQGAEYVYLDELPAGVAVNTSKFLAVVTIPIERNFRI